MRIVERVRAIPEGFVRTYGDIDPGAPRLVGHVLTEAHGIPWHRVVRADGSLPNGAPQRELLLRPCVATGSICAKHVCRPICSDPSPRRLMSRRASGRLLATR